MGHVKTWLTGIGLGYAVPSFEAAGIVTPQALAELNVAHFESLGVDSPEDRRKLFFLVQRIKMAAKENNASATTSSSSAEAASPQRQQGSSNSSVTSTREQVEQVLARTSSLLDDDDDDNDDNSPLKSKSSKDDMQEEETDKAESSTEAERVSVAASKQGQEEEDDLNVSSDKKSADEPGKAGTEALTEVKEEARKSGEEEILPLNQEDSLAGIEPKEGVADASAQVHEVMGDKQINDSLEQPGNNPEQDSPSVAAAPPPPTAAVTIGMDSSNSCCGNSTMTISTSTSTISTHKSRGPPSPEASDRNKNSHNKNTAFTRRKMSKLTTPVRRPVALPGGGSVASSTVSTTISDRSSSQVASQKEPLPATPPLLAMLNSSIEDGTSDHDRDCQAKAAEWEDEHCENYEEEKKQDISVADDDDEDGTAEMEDKIFSNEDTPSMSAGATSSSGSNNSPQSSSSRRVSKRLIEKQFESLKKENPRPAVAASNTSNRSQTATTKGKASTTPAATPTTATATMSNSRRSTVGARRASSDGTIPLQRQSALPAPKNRRATAVGVPKSTRTGKELSSIPSDRIAPMSPLVALPERAGTAAQLIPSTKQQCGRLGGGGDRRTLSDSESDGSSSIGLNKNRRHSHSVERRHHPHRQQNQSSTGSDSSDSPQDRPSYRRRHSEINNRQRTGSHAASTSSDDEVDSSEIVYRVATAARAGMSFESQIAALREENEQEHELFGKVDSIMAANGTDSDEEDITRIRVVVRKRPMSRSEVTNAGDVDVIQPLDYGDYGRILTYQPKTRVDLTKEIETIPFSFDNVFDETASNVQIYERAVRSLIPSFFDGQWASIFAYGQTGSGKTFTMMGSNLTTNGATETENLGLYYLAALDIFQALKTEDFQDYSIGVSLFEIYGGKLYDLLNDRTLVKCLEDSKGKVCFPGLTEHDVDSPDQLMGLIEKGACRRSTGTTSRNADSSRSHAVLQLHLRTMSGSGRRRKQVELSRLSFIDLAGNERGADTYCADRATRMEGAEINTSLLALKEVIRALATGGSMTHVPFRGSKLTQVLKDSFVGKNCHSIMIACISPNIGNCEQTLNTLRYANRVKERNPETGELSTVPDGTSSRRMSSAARNSLSSSFQLSDSLGGAGRSSVLDKKQQQQHSSSDREQSEGGNTTDILDELLASPSPAVTDSDGPGPIYLPGTSSDYLMPLHPRHAVRQLLTEHEAAIPVLLNMLQDEMSLVSEVEAHGGIEDYAAQLDAMHESQLEVFTKLRNMIQAYRDARAASHNPETTFSDDESFEDLRD